MGLRKKMALLKIFIKTMVEKITAIRPLVSSEVAQ